MFSGNFKHVGNTVEFLITIQLTILFDELIFSFPKLNKIINKVQESEARLGSIPLVQIANLWINLWCYSEARVTSAKSLYKKLNVNFVTNIL